ncbi:MAG: glycosyltransferase [Actinobacteria bacterium]|nr:glycosyltransferase [Actinomycetota bacterium]
MIGVLDPITSADTDLEIWAGATWIGQVDEADLDGGRIRLIGGEKFTRARLLVWWEGQPRGFVEAEVTNGVVDGAELLARIAELPPVEPRAPLREFPPISVVVCTRDRPDHLRDMLEHLSQLVYPNVEFIVVDNNPRSGLTPPVVEEFADIPIRVIEAAGQGLSIARNVALKNASHDIVAFTDDDVLVDPAWLTNLAHRFVADERLACVCGMVPSAELVTPAQSYFDRRVGWARRCDPATYDLAEPPEDDRLFPLRVAQFGTGANFAVRRDAVVEMGGFDEGLGIGSPTGGGEDIDLFVRVLLAGWRLGREPSAVVWHRHRRTAAELELQIHNYGLGLGGWIAKLLTRPQTLGMVVRRLAPGIRHLRGITVVDQSDTVDNEPALEGLYKRELRGVLEGPVAMTRARLSGREAAPLRTRSSKLMRALDFRRDQMWGDPGNTILAGRLAMTAVVLGLIGSAGAVRFLPSFVLFFAVGAFMLAGPGSLLLSWYTHLPRYALVPLIPVTSVAVCIIVMTGLLMIDIYSPVAALLGMTSVTIVGGLFRCSYLPQPGEVTEHDSPAPARA